MCIYSRPTVDEPVDCEQGFKRSPLLGWKFRAGNCSAAIPSTNTLHHQHPRTSASPPAFSTLPAASRNLRTHAPPPSNRVSGLLDCRSVASPQHPPTPSITPEESGTVGGPLAGPDVRSLSPTSTIYRCANVFAPGIGRRSNRQICRSNADSRPARPTPRVP